MIPQRHEDTKGLDENEIGRIIVDAAISMHKKLGPGLLESVYEVIFSHELKKRGLKVKRQVPIPIEYDGIKFDEGFRIDIVVNKKVVIELKSVESINRVFKKQVLTYLKLSGCKLGYLLNFGETLMKNGIFRIINGKIG